jgi:HrpA-like RNA helicase
MDLLRRLEAVDEAGRLTPAGQAMRRLPLHPRLARLLLTARRAERAARVVACLSDGVRLPPAVADSGGAPDATTGANLGDFAEDGSFFCGAVCGNLGPSIQQRGRSVSDILFGPPEGKTFLLAAKAQFQEALAELVAVLRSPEFDEAASSTDRQNLAKYLTISKLTLENAITVVRGRGD